MTALHNEDKLVALIDAATAGESDHRPHLGASIIGHECDRFLWLTFRWAFKQKFDGRIKRLFRRGHNEEATVISDLRDADMTVTECLHQQKTHYIAPHVGCTPDGILVGHPEAPRAKHSLEIKTHSLKSFTSLEKEGVEKAHPKHWAQMQCEMVAQRTDRALYFAVCKDNDEIYTERVKLDKEIANSIIERGIRITQSDRIPEPCAGASPSWYICKMCPANDLCWGSKTTKEINCRTCANSTAGSDGKFTCARWDNAEIPFLNQLEGCDCHVLHPDLVKYKMLETDIDWVAVYEIDGKPVANGEPCATVFSSKEIIANPSACADPDDFIKELRNEFGASITG